MAAGSRALFLAWLLLLAGLLLGPTGAAASAAAPRQVAPQDLAATQAEDAAEPRVPVPGASPEALRYYRSGMIQWGLATLLGLQSR